jgi:hypothetical protein
VIGNAIGREESTRKAGYVGILPLTVSRIEPAARQPQITASNFLAGAERAEKRVEMLLAICQNSNDKFIGYGETVGLSF